MRCRRFLAVALLVSACQQPEQHCMSAISYMVPLLEVTNSRGSCEARTDDLLAVAYHLGKLDDGNPDPTTAGMSIVAHSIRERYETALQAVGDQLVLESEYASAFGRFGSEYPDLDDQCLVPDLDELKFSHPRIEIDPNPWPREDPPEAIPADTVTMRWQDIAITVTPQVQGTYLEGRMTVAYASCGSVTYDVRALAEAACDVDADCEGVAGDLPTRCDPDLHVSWKTENTGTCTLRP